MTRNSSLFNLSTDTTVDAGNICNEMRYVNYSDKPNVTTYQVVVNGDIRIGFRALEDIPAQTEMTFDYGYKPPSNDGGRSKRKNIDSLETSRAAKAPRRQTGQQNYG